MDCGAVYEVNVEGIVVALFGVDRVLLEVLSLDCCELLALVQICGLTEFRAALLFLKLVDYVLIVVILCLDQRAILVHKLKILLAVALILKVLPRLWVVVIVRDFILNFLPSFIFFLFDVDMFLLICPMEAEICVFNIWLILSGLFLEQLFFDGIVALVDLVVPLHLSLIKIPVESQILSQELTLG